MRSLKHPSIKFCLLLLVGSGALLIVLGGLLLVNKPTASLVDQRLSTTPGINGQTIDRATIEDYARIKLPPTATDIQAHTERGIDSSILLKFALPPADVAKFLAASGFQSGLKDGYNPLQWQAPDRTTPWWTPKTAKRYAGTASDQPGQFNRHILVDQTNPTQSIIYVEAYSM